jgi:hypothetical protein
VRQETYEYGHGGDPNRDRISLLRNGDQKVIKGADQRAAATADGVQQHGMAELLFAIRFVQGGIDARAERFD